MKTKEIKNSKYKCVTVEEAEKESYHPITKAYEVFSPRRQRDRNDEMTMLDNSIRDLQAGSIDYVLVMVAGGIEIWRKQFEIASV